MNGTECPKAETLIDQARKGGWETESQAGTTDFAVRFDDGSERLHEDVPKVAVIIGARPSDHDMPGPVERNINMLALGIAWFYRPDTGRWRQEMKFGTALLKDGREIELRDWFVTRLMKMTAEEALSEAAENLIKFGTIEEDPCVMGTHCPFQWERPGPKCVLVHNELTTDAERLAAYQELVFYGFDFEDELAETQAALDRLDETYFEDKPEDLAEAKALLSEIQAVNA